MDNNVYDIFHNVKNLFYLGNFQTSLDEANNIEINEEELAQVVRKYFYIFINCVEDLKTDELNDFLANLKEAKDDQLKIYYNLFLFFTVYIYKNNFNEQRFNKLYNDLKNLKKFDPVIFPAIYIISLMLLDRGEYDNFIQLIEKYDGDLEILLLKFYMFLNLNKTEEMQKIVNIMNIKDSESSITQLCSIIFKLYKNNDHADVLSSLQNINKNGMLTIKLFNMIGVTLLSYCNFEEACKILNLAKDMLEKNGATSKDYNCILVNLICAHRNLGNEKEVYDHEEILRKSDPKNKYFSKISLFEEEYNKLISE